MTAQWMRARSHDKSLFYGPLPCLSLVLPRYRAAGSGISAAGAESCKRAAGFLAFLTLSIKALQASSQLLDAIRKRKRSDAANLPWFPDRMSFSRIFLRFPAFFLHFPAVFPAFFLRFSCRSLLAKIHLRLSGGVGSKGLIHQRGNWRIRQSGAKCSGSRLAFLPEFYHTSYTCLCPPPPLYGRNLFDWTPFPFAFFPLPFLVNFSRLGFSWLFMAFRPQSKANPF